MQAPRAQRPHFQEQGVTTSAGRAMVPLALRGGGVGGGSPGGRRSRRGDEPLRPGARASARGRVWARCAQHPRVTRTCPREPPPASRFLPPPAPESCLRGDPGAPAPWGASPAFSVPGPEADVGAQTGRPFSPIFSQTEQRPGSGRRRPEPLPAARLPGCRV